MINNTINRYNNRPSGQIQHPEAVISLTRRMKQGGEFMELPILNYIIVGQDKYYSFTDDGRIYVFLMRPVSFLKNV
jgi:DNA repair protein RadC